MPSSVKDRFTVDFEYLFFFVKNKKYWFEQQFEDYAIASEVRYRQRLRSGKQYNTKTPYKTNTLSCQAYKAGQGAVQSRGQYKDHLCVGGTYDQGRNKRCVWKITTKPFPDVHFAVYPPDLIVTPIKAGCPEYVCSRCGQARQKIWQGRSKNAFNIRIQDVKAQKIKHTDRHASQKEIEEYDEKSYGGTGKKFIGYTRCRCKAAFLPGTVLDPFIGSGTTAVVARQLGRNYVGIELNPKYVKIAKRRLKQEGKKNDGQNKMKNLIISKSAFAAIEKECLSYPQVETGGILVGVCIDQDIIVPFALGSGPAAVRMPCRFKPDVLWQQKRLDQYFEQYGLNYVGSFHRHPGNYRRPSPIDYRTAIDILTDPDWAVDEIVFPIILLGVMTIVIYPYYINSKHMEFEALPLGIMPDDHDLIIQKPKKVIDYENSDLRRSP